jgi:hypothetical protein
MLVIAYFLSKLGHEVVKSAVQYLEFLNARTKVPWLSPPPPMTIDNWLPTAPSYVKVKISFDQL